MRTPLKTLTDFDKENLELLNSILIGIWGAINSGIEFGTVASSAENVRCTLKTFTTPATANSEFSVAHGLGKIPTGYWLSNTNLGCKMYDGGTANTDTNLYLKCDTVSVSGTLIII